MDLVRETESSLLVKAHGQCGLMVKTISMMMELEESKEVEFIHSSLCNQLFLDNSLGSFSEIQMLCHQ